MKIRRVGILTFHRADNLGAVLQSYALQHTLEDKCGVEVRIIDYVCPGEENIRKGKGFKGLMLKAYYAVKHRGFQQFRKDKLHLTDRCDRETISRVAEGFDAVIVGSDQVWNYECTGWDDTYFMDFPLDGVKKYSYAASLGRYRFSEIERPKVGAMLAAFDRISVREEVARRELSGMTDQTIAVLPDPVFLLSRREWRDIMASRRLRQKYVFVYLILPDVHVMAAAEDFARENGFRLISNKKSPEFMLSGSPSDFISWIFHAERVFTNSFHGTAFALLFGKPLGAEVKLKDGSPNHRVLEVLKKTDAGEACILRDKTDRGAIVEVRSTVAQMAREGLEYLEGMFH